MRSVACRWSIWMVRLFEQALLNVLDNALRYSPAGSPLSNRHPAAWTAKFRSASSTPAVGVAEADRELVFEKFRRGSNAPRSDGGVGPGFDHLPGDFARPWRRNHDGVGRRAAEPS